MILKYFIYDIDENKAHLFITFLCHLYFFIGCMMTVERQPHFISLLYASCLQRLIFTMTKHNVLFLFMLFAGGQRLCDAYTYWGPYQLFTHVDLRPDDWCNGTSTVSEATCLSLSGQKILSLFLCEKGGHCFTDIFTTGIFW